MRNLNNYIKCAAVLCFFILNSRISIAGVATEYDEVNLTTYQSGDDIFGYYRAHNDMFWCGFLFMANLKIGEKSANGTNVLLMKTFDFAPHKNQFSYVRRDPRAEVDGTLDLHDKELALKTDHPHGGCQTAAGVFNAAPGERGASQYSMTKKFDAIGIAIATRKTFFYEKAGTGRRQQYLVAGDIVTLISRRNGYSYARFVNSDMAIDEGNARKITFGWLRDDDLANPFPRSPMKELQERENANSGNHDRSNPTR